MQKQVKKSTQLWICPSCGRFGGTDTDSVTTVTYLEQGWCSRCAKVRTIGGRTFVAQPSPGRMIKGAEFDILDSWLDCFGTQPKHRITVRMAREEIQRAWVMWSGDKDQVMSMMMFFCWLQRHRPYFLTFREKYDPWQTVHSWLLEADRIMRTEIKAKIASK